MIRKKVMAQFKSEQWSKHSLLNATVHDGTVKLWGMVDSEAEKEAARLAAEQVAGVQAIENNVIVQPGAGKLG
jgi:osmotically-inducible protein OsmY